MNDRERIEKLLERESRTMQRQKLFKQLRRLERQQQQGKEKPGGASSRTQEAAV